MKTTGLIGAVLAALVFAGSAQASEPADNFEARAEHVLAVMRTQLLGTGVWREAEGKPYLVNRTVNDIGKHWWPRVFAELAVGAAAERTITQRDGSVITVRELMAGLVHNAPDDRSDRPDRNPAIGYLYFSPVGLGRVLHAVPGALSEAEQLTLYTATLHYDPSHAALNMLTGQGTENHMLMGRTGGYLISQAVVARGGDDPLSGHLHAEAVRWQAELREYFLSTAHTTYERGFGEWDSSTYYPYVAACWVSLFDHAADPAVRDAARAVLDWMATGLALRHSWGVFGGAEQRSGAPLQAGQSNWDKWAWLWWGGAEPTWRGQDFGQMAYAALSGYRPPAVLADLVRLAGAGPAARTGPTFGRHFETKPSYVVHGDDAVRQQTRVLFYDRGDFTLGAVLARPTGGWTGGNNQDLLWKLVARDTAAGAAVVHGGLGRDPWRQVGQWDGVLIDVWHRPENAAALQAEASAKIAEWQVKRRESLRRAFPQDTSREVRVSERQMVIEERRARLIFSDGREVVLPENGAPVFETLGETFLAIRAVGKGLGEIAPGKFGGYFMEVGSGRDYGTLQAFAAAVEARDQETSPEIVGGRVSLRTLADEQVEFVYETSGTYVEPEYDWGFGADREGGYVIMAMPPFQFPVWPAGEGHGRVPTLRVDGVDVAAMFDEATYRGPNINLRDEVLEVSDGRKTYWVDWRGRRGEVAGVNAQ
jgi:hypothetical protein